MGGLSGVYYSRVYITFLPYTYRLVSMTTVKEHNHTIHTKHCTTMTDDQKNTKTPKHLLCGKRGSSLPALPFPSLIKTHHIRLPFGFVRIPRHATLHAAARAPRRPREGKRPGLPGTHHVTSCCTKSWRAKRTTVDLAPPARDPPCDANRDLFGAKREG